MNKDNPQITIDDIINNIKYIDNQEEVEKIKKAYKFALNIHKNQKRLTGDDYIKHPLNVANILSTINADAETIIAALLHDTISVGNANIEDIESKFGKEVASLVSGVTKINKLNYNNTTEATINNHRKILVGLTEDVRVIFIKLADRLHNMRTMGVLQAEKQKENANETLEILIPIAHRLGINQIKSELEDLSLRYLKPDVYFSIVERLNKSKNERNKYVQEMMDNVSILLNEHNIKHEIIGRAKSIYSIYKKLDKGKRFSDIYDLLALRVFVDTVSDCYQAMGLIHSKYRPVPKRFKDYIAMPKSNMYQSLHTTVFGPDGNFFEIQIRTYEMDEIAERGIASHWSYKEKGKNLMKGMEDKLQFFRSVMEIKDSNEEDMKNITEALKNTVYIYTPKGDVIELPYGSTPIDFAYRIHSKVGDSMIGAIVNETIVPLDYILQDNDVVKINTSNNSQGPSKNWIDMAYTNQAKNKIRSFFNKIDKSEYLKIGEELLNKELRKRKLPISEFITDENIEKILSELHLAHVNDLYINIGNGKFAPLQVINIITKEDINKEETILNQITDSNESSHNGDIIVAGIGNIKINLAKCCNPIPGDDIVGFIQNGIGVNVHRKICPNISQVTEKLINVNWNDNIIDKYSTHIIVYTDSTKDLILNIVSSAKNNGISIKSINTNKNSLKNIYDLKLSVKDVDNLNKYMNQINQMTEVINVERVIK